MQPAPRVTRHESAPGFSYTRLEPRGAASAVAAGYWEVRARRCRAAIEAAFPDTHVEICFNLGSTGREVVDDRFAGRPGPRAAWVSAPRVRTTLIAKETADSDIVGIRLQPTAARWLLGVPIRELGGTLVDLDLLWGSRTEEIRCQLAGARDTMARMAIVERELLDRAAKARQESWVVRRLCEAVESRAARSVGELAEQMGLTHKRVIALFDEHVGHKPKLYQRLHRLRRVLAAAATDGPVPWARIAIQEGCCDQAHLIHEFRSLTGYTPGDYAARRMRAGDGYLPYRLAPGFQAPGTADPAALTGSSH